MADRSWIDRLWDAVVMHRRREIEAENRRRQITQACRVAEEAMARREGYLRVMQAIVRRGAYMPPDDVDQ